MKRPKLLDLFCGAGGAAMGYHRAGFDVTGVDLHPQPEYPFKMFEADAMTFSLSGFDVVHASPPCQAYSSLRTIFATARGDHPNLVDDVRAKFVANGVPYVIENVVGSPLRNAFVLCGSMFGLAVRRHRLFECSEIILNPSCQHPPVRAVAVYGDHAQDGSAGRINRAKTLVEGRDAMGIDWMSWRPLTQAIPPAYTEHIGRQISFVAHGKR